MGKKLDNWAFILGILGLVSVVFGAINLSAGGNIATTILATLLGVAGFAGLIVGIVGLVMKSQQKWKPILGIVFYVVALILNVVIGFSLAF